MLSALIVLGLLTGAPAATDAVPATLVAFLAGYSEAILHAAPGSEGMGASEGVLDFWKHTGSAERDAEAVEYLRNRGLFEEVEGGRIFFLRLLSEEELSEMFHFKMEVSDPTVRESLETRFFRFALIRMVDVNAAGEVDPEPLGLEGEAPLSLDDLRHRVAGYLQDPGSRQAEKEPMDPTAGSADPVE